MTFTSPMRKGVLVMALLTTGFTALSIMFLWIRARALDVAPWDFFIMAFIVTVVWTAIGAVMTFYIVMILHKNAKKER